MLRYSDSEDVADGRLHSVGLGMSRQGGKEGVVQDLTARYQTYLSPSTCSVQYLYRAFYNVFAVTVSAISLVTIYCRFGVDFYWFSPNKIKVSVLLLRQAVQSRDGLCYG